MVKNKRNTRTDLYDLCSCYEPIEMPPEGTFDTFKEPEPTLENTSFYATEEDGKLYFYCGKTKIEVIEHCANWVSKPYSFLTPAVARILILKSAT